MCRKPMPPPVQPKGRRGRSPHRRPAPPKAPSANNSGKAALPVLTLAVPAAQALSSPDLSGLSVDDGLEGITDQSSMPGTFEAAKDLNDLSAASPLPYGENPPTPMPQVLSRDEAVAGTEVAGPPPIGHGAHQKLLHRVAQNLGLQAKETVEQEDPMVDILSPEGPSRIALVLIKTIQSTYKTIWQTPSFSAPMAKGVERKYFAPSKGYEFLFCHPSPCSLVVSAINERERHGQQAPAPEAREAKRLDLFGRKVYSSAGLQLRIANQQAILNRHNFNSWAAVGKFKDNLPQGSQQEFMTLVDEGKAVAKTSLQASLDSADLVARTIASGVVMRRSAWLQESGLPPEVQNTLQDLPFKGSGLFSDQTDTRLHSLKDSRATLKLLGMHTLVTQRKPFKPQPPPQRQYQPRHRHEPYRRRGRDNRRRCNNNTNNNAPGQNQAQHKPQLGTKPDF
ncbi:hypothetical protein UY3_00081 [Chelonia mydas]|uniref:Lamina-associated polypeptide 2 alpha C-terminal domain-containing protein n=1 Tax=Chelonia mydas TaxID=8469 RepID=M7BXM2_CHEMY|nr:hypothetical protein UY3_00081 [Chelonia mydas]